MAGRPRKVGFPHCIPTDLATHPRIPLMNLTYQMSVVDLPNGFPPGSPRRAGPLQ
jgi:hypothetical protein